MKETSLSNKWEILQYCTLASGHIVWYDFLLNSLMMNVIDHYSVYK